MRDVGHAAAFGLLSDRFACRALRADENHAAPFGCQAAGKVEGIDHQRQCPLKVDDVDFPTRAEDVGFHLGVPVAGLVSKVYACFEHLAHCHVCHESFLQVRGNGHPWMSISRVNPPCTLFGNPGLRAEAPNRTVAVHVRICVISMGFFSLSSRAFDSWRRPGKRFIPERWG